MNIIKSSVQISEVFDLGTSFYADNVRLVVKQNPDSSGSTGRVAFIAGKKIGNAVVRNRSKRVLREAARASGLPIPGYDILLIATFKTKNDSQERICWSIGRILGKAGIL